MNHFKRQCKSKSKVKDKSAEVKEETKPNSNATEESDGHLYAIEQGTLSHVSTADLMWDKNTKRWIQRPASVKKTNNLSVVLSVCRDSHNELNVKNKSIPGNIKLFPVSTPALRTQDVL